MPEIDEISRTIGKLEGCIKALVQEQIRQGEQLTRIEESLSGLKIKIASLAGAISIITTIVIIWVRAAIN